MGLNPGTATCYLSVGLANKDNDFALCVLLQVAELPVSPAEEAQ